MAKKALISNTATTQRDQTENRCAAGPLDDSLAGNHCEEGNTAVMTAMSTMQSVAMKRSSAR
jgi:hypothetical protein